MATTASDGLPCYPAAPASGLLARHHDHQLYQATAASSFLGTSAQEPQPSAPPAAAEQRKPRKRARASRRTPTTVLTTDASNFRAMVQEFTGFPAPPPFHLGAGVLFGAGSGSVAAAPFHHQLLRPSPLKLSSAASGSTSSFAHTLFANSDANPAAAAASGTAPGLGPELFGRFGGPAFAAGAVPSYGEGFAAEMGGGRVEHGHGLATSFLHAGDRYHSH